MEFVVKGPFKENIYSLMRKVGYFFEGKEEAKNELIFTRPSKGFPRFHLYLRQKLETNEIIFDLHLDQKRPIYKGVAAHCAEYGGKVIETEAKRIKQILESLKKGN